MARAEADWVDDAGRDITLSGSQLFAARGYPADVSAGKCCPWGEPLPHPERNYCPACAERVAENVLAALVEALAELKVR
jgi:hypothetical protein